MPDNKIGGGNPFDPYHVKQYMEFDESDPRYQIKLLGIRVDALTKEKEEVELELREEREERKKLDVRVAHMEKSFQRGAGMMIMLPIIGTLVGFIFAYAKILFGGK